VAVVALLVGTSLLLILNASDDGSRIRIDGDMADWEGVTLANDERGDTANPNVDLISYGVISDGLYLSVYLTTDEPLLFGADIRTARILIDSDLDPDTGFAFQGLGADYLIEIAGKREVVYTGMLYTFEDGSRGPHDWNGFEALTPISAMAGGNAIETQVPLFDLNLEASQAVAVAFQTTDKNGNGDTSDLLVSNLLEPLAATFVPYDIDFLAPGATTKVGTLRLVAPQSGVSLDSVTFSYTSTATGEAITAARLGDHRESNGGLTFTNLHISLEAGEELELPLRLTLDPDLEPGKALGLDLTSINTEALPTLSGSLEPTYVESVSADIVIDGAFGDWAGLHKETDEPNDVEDPDGDLRRHATVSDLDDERTFVYLEVKGDMLEGAWIPVTEAKTGPREQGQKSSPETQPSKPADLPELTGEDTIFIFLDTDQDPGTGYSTSSELIGADRLVTLKGVGGRITQQTLSRFDGGDAPTKWAWRNIGDIGAAATGSRLELDLGMSLKPQDVRVLVLGWDGQEDWTFDFEEQGARASDGSYDLDGTEKTGEAFVHSYILTITAPYHSGLGDHEIHLILNGTNVTRRTQTTADVQPLTITSTRDEENVTITIFYWDEDAQIARVDFGVIKDLPLQKGQTVRVDRDGIGGDDTEVTLIVFDSQGIPVVTMIPIEAADDDDDDEVFLGIPLAWCPWLLLLLFAIIILYLLYRKPAIIAAAPPPALPPMPHLLASVGEQMEGGFYYFVDEHGNISRVTDDDLTPEQRGDGQVDLRRKIGLDPRPMCMIYYKDIDPDLILPAPAPRPMGKGKVSTLNLQREPGYFYYIDKNGDISRSRMARGTEEGGDRELIMKVGLVREPDWFYFIDKDGDISRTRRVKGGKEKVMKLEGEEEDDEPASLVPMAGIEPWKVTSVGVWMEPDRFYSLDANRSIVSSLIHDGHELEGKGEVVIPVLEDTDHGYFVLHYYPEPKMEAPRVRPPKPRSKPAPKPKPEPEPEPEPSAPATPAAPKWCLADYGLKKEPGYFYYVDSDGHISRNLMAKGPDPAGPRELMAETGVEREAGWLYYVNKEGCIQKAKMRRGPPKSKAEKQAAPPAPAPVKKAPKPKPKPKPEAPPTPGPPKLCLEDYGLKKEPGYFYYVDSEGNISRNLMAKGPEPAGPRELMAETGIERETGWLYYVNKEGCIKKAKMRRGPPKSKTAGK